MGTFVVNIFATTVLGASTIAGRGKASWKADDKIVNGKLTCQLVEGLQMASVALFQQSQKCLLK